MMSAYNRNDIVRVVERTQLIKECELDNSSEKCSRKRKS